MQGEHPIPHDVVKRTSENSGQICPNLFLLGALAGTCILVDTHLVTRRKVRSYHYLTEAYNCLLWRQI